MPKKFAPKPHLRGEIFAADFPEGQRFTGVEWPDFAVLRERVTVLETLFEERQQAKIITRSWWQQILSGLLPTVLSAAISVALAYYVAKTTSDGNEAAKTLPSNMSK